jgi:hypothetical protein
MLWTTSSSKRSVNECVVSLVGYGNGYGQDSSIRSQKIHLAILMNKETISTLHNSLVVAFGPL